MGDTPSPSARDDEFIHVELGVDDMMSMPPQLIEKLPEVSAYLVEEILTEADVEVVDDKGKKGGRGG